MDSWKKHLVFGLILELLFLIIMFFWKGWFNDFNLVSFQQLFIILLISPLFADLDHKQGKLREVLTLIGLTISIIAVLLYYININVIELMVYGVLISFFSYGLFYITKHRGFIHTLPCCIVYSLFLYVFTLNIYLSVLGFVGYYSHLLGDKLYFRIL